MNATYLENGLYILRLGLLDIDGTKLLEIRDFHPANG